MTLIGLNRCKRSGRRLPVAIGLVLDVLLEDGEWVRIVGDLASLLWTSAELVLDQISAICEETQAPNALDQLDNGHLCSTMRVAC